MMASRWTDDFLDRMREEGDPLADRTVAAIFERGDLDEVNRLMRTLIRDDGVPSDELPPEVREYLEASSRLPDWMDPAVVERGEELFVDHGITSTVLLSCASLPECYVMKNGIHVLWLTQKLEEHVHRRVLETAQMIMDVMSPGGLGSAGKGLRSAQKVRLMHASIRHLVLQEPEDTEPQGRPEGFAEVLGRHRWNPAYGHPVCQEDMAYTLMTFSWVGVRGLEDLGVALDDADKDAYIHCWNVVGHVMGIRDDLLPADHREAETLFRTIKERQQGATPEGQGMTAALVGFVESLFPRLLRPVPRLLMRELLGDPTADLLAIPPAGGLQRVVQRLLVGAWRLVDREIGKVDVSHPRLHHLSERLHLELLKKWGAMPRGWQRELFSLPDHLALEP